MRNRKKTPLLWLRLLGLALALSAVGACQNTSINQEFAAADIQNRTVLMPRPTLQPPLSPTLQQHLLRLGETKARQLKSWRKFISEEAFLARYKTQPAQRTTYALFAELFSTTGIADRQNTAKVGALVEAELLLFLQFYQVPCPEVCPEGGQFFISSSLLEAQSGKILWKGVFARKIEPDITAEALQPLALEMLDDWEEALEEALRLKWHRLRHTHLGKKTS